ncbi:rhoptry neck protein 3, putative [Hepatocystis sp. ex Piliocolobus tephrosceles]|nr:rhoptry neck protein 3, putative [Hepatocystis sp. ex Piliocolobus tephrosceles]
MLLVSFRTCREVENKGTKFLYNYNDNNGLGLNAQNARIKNRRYVKANNENSNEYSFLSMKASHIFNQVYVASLINSIFLRGLKKSDNLHKNPAVYESFVRTNIFFYTVVLNKKNLKNIVRLLTRAQNSKNKYETFKKELITNFNSPNFEIDSKMRTEMDQAIIVYKKAKTDAYWNMVDAVKHDGLLYAKTFMVMSFTQSLKGFVGLANSELLDICFSQAFLYNDIASFDRLILSNIFGTVLSFVFKSFLIFFYPLMVPFRGVFAFMLSSICITQMSKILFLLYKNLRKLYRISRRKIYTSILKVRLRNHPEFQPYAMNLLQGDALILVSKMWKLSYVNIDSHLQGNNLYPILNNLFENNFGSGFFNFSNALFSYILENLRKFKLITEKGMNLETADKFNSKIFEKVLFMLEVTKNALLYEETYASIATASILVKLYTAIVVNINYLGKIVPKEHFGTDIDSEFRHIYGEQLHETFLQRTINTLTRKSYIKQNLNKINRGSIQFTMALVKIKLLHYKPDAKHPYFSFYFDDALKSQLNKAMRSILVGTNGIISSFVVFGERYKMLRKCPLENLKNMRHLCDIEGYKIKRLLLGFKIFISLLLPLYMSDTDVLINNQVVGHMLHFFEVMIEDKSLYTYTYLKEIIDLTYKYERKDTVLDTNNINYDEEIKNLLHREINKVLNDVNKEKRSNLKFHSYELKNEEVSLYNVQGEHYKFVFNQKNMVQKFANVIHSNDYGSSIMQHLSFIRFEPVQGNGGNLIVDANHYSFTGNLTQSHIYTADNKDLLITDLIFYTLWASGIDKFSAMIFSSLFGAVKQLFHNGLSWKRAIMLMQPTEFYSVVDMFVNKSMIEADKSLNFFIKRVKKYRFHFNKTTFVSMFRLFLENVLVRINFYDPEEAMIIIAMSALYALYRNVEKNKLLIDQTYKLYQQKLIEAYYPVDKYAYNYEKHMFNLLKNKKKKLNSEAIGKINDVNETAETVPLIEKNNIELPIKYPLVQSTKYMQLELENTEKERETLVEDITKKYGAIPFYASYQKLPSKCLFLLYFDYTSFIKENLNGIEKVLNMISKNKLKKNTIEQIFIYQEKSTSFADITDNDLIRILCGTHLFLLKENVPFYNLYDSSIANNVVKHLLLYLGLLRIKKKNNVHSWKTYLTLMKYMDERRYYYETPMKYLYLKIFNLRKLFAHRGRGMLLSLGNNNKHPRILNIIQSARVFKLFQKAEMYNDSYPSEYINFEEILIFTNVFNRFKFSLVQQISSESNIKSSLNHFKLAPSYSPNTEKQLKQIFRVLNNIIKRKFNVDLTSYKKNFQDLDKFGENKNEHIIKYIHFRIDIQNYLHQLFGFIKLLTDMKFTNFLFIRQLYFFIKMYAITGDINYSLENSSIHMANIHYLKFIFNAILEFEPFKKLILELQNDGNNVRANFVDYTNFLVQCHTTENIQIYKFDSTSEGSIQKFRDIMNTEVDHFFKTYIAIRTFYNDMKIPIIGKYYPYYALFDLDELRKLQFKYRRDQNAELITDSLKDINNIHSSMKNYVYLRNFLLGYDIPIIPVDNFLIRGTDQKAKLSFTNTATTAPFYKKNILHQFEIIGKSFTSSFYDKVKCSFITYPFNLYYWFVLNPGKPFVEAISETGMIKKTDLFPKTDQQKEKEEIEKDEKIVDNLFKLYETGEKQYEEDGSDRMSLESTSVGSRSRSSSVSSYETVPDEEEGASYESAKEEASAETSSIESIDSDNFTDVPETQKLEDYSIPKAPLSTQDSTTLDSTRIQEQVPQKKADIGDITRIAASRPAQIMTPITLPIVEQEGLYAQDNNGFIRQNNGNNDESRGDKGGRTPIFSLRNRSSSASFITVKQHSIMDKVSKTVNESNKFIKNKNFSFVQKKIENNLKFDSNLIDVKRNPEFTASFGYFDRPYNMYVSQTGIYRNFQLVLQIVHTFMSLNRFSVVSPVDIIKKGIEILSTETDSIQVNEYNPFLYKTILDINEVIQNEKLESSRLRLHKLGNLFVAYKSIEFQLFNSFEIFPTLKRLNRSELLYILKVIKQGYSYHLQKVLNKLKQKRKFPYSIRKALATMNEYKELFDEEMLKKFSELIIQSLKCTDVNELNKLLEDFKNIIFDYEVKKTLEDTNNIDVMKTIINNTPIIKFYQEKLEKTYKGNVEKPETVKTTIELEKVEKNKLSNVEFVYGSINLPYALQNHLSILTLFNIQHIYMNVGYILTGIKYKIKRSLKTFRQTYSFKTLFGRPPAPFYIP